VTTLKGNTRTNKNDSRMLRKKGGTKINRQKKRRNGKDKLFLLSSLTGHVLVTLRLVNIYQILIE
jgi:hypothetical protein